MPEVAAGATEIVLSKWLVSVGDQVNAGDLIAEMETEKAVVDYASDFGGKVHRIMASEGADVEVGSPILILLDAGEDGSAGDALLGGGGTATSTPAAQPVAEQPTSPQAPVVSPVIATVTPLVSPLVSPVASPVVTVAPAATAGDRTFVSPLVRKLARETGVDLAQVVGTGPNGRKVRRDLEAYLANRPTTSTTQKTQQPTSPVSATLAAGNVMSEPAGFTAVPHTGMRRAIARRLTESKSTVPHFYLSADCNVDELLELRKRINAASPVKISVNDLVVRAVALALVDVPEANVIWTPEAMHRFDSVDISVAVSTDGGLLTPIVRSAEKRSLANLSAEIADLATRSRAGKLRQEELEGGSFAVTNLGMFGTKEFAAILNPPQSGILAVGAASKRVVVIGDEISIANIMTVTLSADHRAIDGALAAQWLAAFVSRIENPLSMLI
jgi:pyruvate dehydrogenase E2 component (dihydrolipoamide acetyltransferase)